MADQKPTLNSLGTRIYDPDDFEFPERVWLLLPGDEHPPTPELTTDPDSLAVLTAPGHPDLQRYNAREYVPAIRLTQLQADIEGEIKDCRDIADDHRWAPEIRSTRSSAARRLQAILDKSRERGEG